MDYARDGKGGIKCMLYNENGARYDTTNGTPAPLEDDIGELIEIPPWELGMV